jgi:hypothetical protein
MLILKKRIADCGLNLSGAKCGPVASSYEHYNEPSGTTDFWIFLELLSN